MAMQTAADVGGGIGQINAGNTVGGALQLGSGLLGVASVAPFGRAFGWMSGAALSRSPATNFGTPVWSVSKNGAYSQKFGAGTLEANFGLTTEYSSGSTRFFGTQHIGGNSTTRPLQLEEFVAPSTGKSVQAAVNGNAIVPVDKVSIYARGGVADVSQELRVLQNLKQSSRKLFDANPENFDRLDQLKLMQHNYERSKAMARELDKVGFTNTPANNKILINHLLETGQLVGPANRVWVPSVLEGPNGALQVKSTWKIMDDNRAYLNTLIFVPVK